MHETKSGVLYEKLCVRIVKTNKLGVITELLGFFEDERKKALDEAKLKFPTLISGRIVEGKESAEQMLQFCHSWHHEVMAWLKEQFGE